MKQFSSVYVDLPALFLLSSLPHLNKMIFPNKAIQSLNFSCQTKKLIFLQSALNWDVPWRSHCLAKQIDLYSNDDMIERERGVQISRSKLNTFKIFVDNSIDFENVALIVKIICSFMFFKSMNTIIRTASIKLVLETLNSFRELRIKTPTDY